MHLSPVVAVVIVDVAVVIVDVDIVVVDVVSAKKNDIGRAAGFVSSFFFVAEVQSGRMVMVLGQVERILAEFENYRIL